MLNLSQKLSQQLRQSPQQVLLSSLLQLPTVMLEQKLRMELEQNPLLEVVDDMEMETEQEQEEEMTLEQKEEEPPEAESEAAMEEAESEKEEIEKDDVDWEAILGDEENYEYRAPRDNSVEVYEQQEASPETLPEHLLTQLHMQRLSEEEITIGEYLIWNINEDGYLACSVELVAQNLGTTVEKVEAVLRQIQRFDPVGIAARNLQECLLIQLEDKLPRHELAIRIIRECFDDFTNKRFEKIAKKLEVSLDDIKEAMEEITQLNPKPGEGYFSAQDNAIVPDLTVERDGDGFRIILHDSNVPHLRINNRYKEILLKNAKNRQQAREAREFVKKRLESARWLINSIHQRRLTILRVMEAIVQKQREFFEHGKQYIKPMILKDIADEIGMDISTVSRVTNGKYVQTEHGVFELKYFFSEGLKSDDGDEVSNRRIKQRIQEIINAEDPSKPLNDQTIANILKRENFNVARRTVAKYREQMMIPVSRLRRKI
ncbi:MAG: RNA polymerase factor sigma-54 [candidate division KSB1 bacterium]|nr:RNA polymerase factor sigma-54 [candidate division KSB1 bacterium]MDZ7276057.1 RNA polymerase factor sigma-54 [candidate division KSB1 bacterium]MDZ7285661.1 RNA polymerase factor sigma-54 [candidate division KSB1 bacterium]MDZ7298693.1 RNA polymerase factor sigma-54 [candidate division KSB1 bacterium]MDZ7307558.1 RNA polymerase factor sigma-54 [candidate division KSB1 bacterium]